MLVPYCSAVFSGIAVRESSAAEQPVGRLVRIRDRAAVDVRRVLVENIADRRPQREARVELETRFDIVVQDRVDSLRLYGQRQTSKAGSTRSV